MHKNTFKIISMVTLITLLYVGAAWAGDRGRGGEELTRHERKALRHDRNQIRQFEKFAAADGRVSRQERRLLENMHGRLDRDRHYYRHNDQRRYDCRRGCRDSHDHRWREYRPCYEYRPHGYFYPGHGHYQFSGAWLQPGGFFSISVGGN